jgi:hypothetical protein
MRMVHPPRSLVFPAHKLVGSYGQRQARSIEN